MPVISSAREAERTRLDLENPPPSVWERHCPPDVLSRAPFPAIVAYLKRTETRALLSELERAETYPDPILDALRALGLMRLFSELPVPGDDPGNWCVDVTRLCALNVLLARHSGTLASTVGINGLGLLPTYYRATPRRGPRARRAPVRARRDRRHRRPRADRVRG
jgi:hypothetical protein